MKVILPPWSSTINTTFIPLIQNRDRYLICYGGRGSSKSVFAAKKLIWRCLAEPYFRYLLIRKTANTIKDSSYQTIKDIIEEWGLQELFDFKLQPLEIHCKNGNCFLARGCDDTTKIKSVKDPTGAWYEEDIIDEADFITITTGIRTTKATYLQEIFTINPEVDGNYEEHWFYKRFFTGYYDQGKYSFSATTSMTVPIFNQSTSTYTDQEISLSYTVHHSTHKDNRWLPAEFRAFLMDLKVKNPYYWEIYCNGRWGNKEVGARFYKAFNIGVHTDVCKYDPNLPLHISFDDNRNPYLPCGIFQIEGKSVRMIDEISGRYPQNTVKAVCTELKKRYYNHRSGLFIYGDATARKGDTKIEQGSNFFYLIQNELNIYSPVLRVPQANPSVMMRGIFMNEIMASRYAGISFKIGANCTDCKNDFNNVKEDHEGGKLDEMETDKETGVRYQKWGHYSDLTDYLYCEVFKKDYQNLQRGDMSIINRSFGRGNDKQRKSKRL